MLRRVSFVLLLFVAVLLAGGLPRPGAALAEGLAGPVNNLGLRTIPLRVNNQSGHPGRLYLYVVGQVPGRGGRYFYLSDLDGNLTLVPEAAEPVSLALDLGRDPALRLRLPQLTAARIYVSLGRPVVVTAAAEGAAPSSPPGWVRTDPNFGRLFDFAEFTWLDDPAGSPFQSTFGGNLTQVDMFAIAMRLTLRGKDGGGAEVVRRSGFARPEARRRILAEIARAGRPWSRLVIRPKAEIPLRIVAPYHGMNLGLFPQNQLRRHINQVWAKYRDQALVGTARSGDDNIDHLFRGRVVGGELLFRQIGGSETFRFAKPTSFAAYQNDLPPILPQPHTAAAADRAGVIGALLGAGLMRTTLLDLRNLRSCRRQAFYQREPVNLYARLFHDYGIRGQAYSFGFDDTCDQASFIQIHDPSAAVLTLQPL